MDSGLFYRINKEGKFLQYKHQAEKSGTVFPWKEITKDSFEQYTDSRAKEQIISLGSLNEQLAQTDTIHFILKEVQYEKGLWNFSQYTYITPQKIELGTLLSGAGAKTTLFSISCDRYGPILSGVPDATQESTDSGRLYVDSNGFLKIKN